MSSDASGSVAGAAEDAMLDPIALDSVAIEIEESAILPDLVNGVAARPTTRIAPRPHPILTTAKEAHALAARLNNYKAVLEPPIRDGSPPNPIMLLTPIMVLTTMLSFLGRDEATLLSGEAQTAFPDKDSLITRIKIFVLLNVVKNVNSELFALLRPWCDEDPKTFFQKAAAIAAERGLDGDITMLGALRTLNHWTRRLFPEQNQITA